MVMLLVVTMVFVLVAVVVVAVVFGDSNGSCGGKGSDKTNGSDNCQSSGNVL